MSARGKRRRKSRPRTRAGRAATLAAAVAFAAGERVRWSAKYLRSQARLKHRQWQARPDLAAWRGTVTAVRDEFVWVRWDGEAEDTLRGGVHRDHVARLDAGPPGGGA